MHDHPGQADSTPYFSFLPPRARGYLSEPATRFVLLSQLHGKGSSSPPSATSGRSDSGEHGGFRLHLLMRLLQCNRAKQLCKESSIFLGLISVQQ